METSHLPLISQLLPGHSYSGPVSHNQSTDSLIPAQPRRICSYVADPARSLCIHRKSGSSGTAAHPRSPTLHLSTLRFQCFHQQHVDMSFPHGEGRFPMVEVSTQCSEGYPNRTRPSVVHGCIEHQLGSTLECINVVRCMDNNRENASHQCIRVRSHT